MRRALDIAFHDQIRLVHFFERARFFADRDRERTQTHRSAIKFVDERFDDPLVPLIETIAIDLQHRQRAIGQVGGDFSIGFYLHKIADPAEQIIGRARRASCAQSDLGRARRIDFDAEQSRAPQNDFLHLFRVVIIEPRRHSETRAQRCAHHAGAGRRADERELRQM